MKNVLEKDVYGSNKEKYYGVIDRGMYYEKVGECELENCEELLEGEVYKDFSIGINLDKGKVKDRLMELVGDCRDRKKKWVDVGELCENKDVENYIKKELDNVCSDNNWKRIGWKIGIEYKRKEGVKKSNISVFKSIYYEMERGLFEVINGCKMGERRSKLLRVVVDYKGVINERMVDEFLDCVDRLKLEYIIKDIVEKKKDKLESVRSNNMCKRYFNNIDRMLKYLE